MISSGGLLHSQNPTVVDRYSCSGRDLMPRTRSGRSLLPRLNWTSSQSNLRGEDGRLLRLNVPCQDRRRNNALKLGLRVLCEFELRVSLNEFFCAAAGKTYRHAPVFIVAFHAHNRSGAIGWMPNFSPQHRVGIGSSL